MSGFKDADGVSGDMNVTSADGAASSDAATVKVDIKVKVDVPGKSGADGSIWDLPYMPPKVNASPTAGRHSTTMTDVTVDGRDSDEIAKRRVIPPREKYAAEKDAPPFDAAKPKWQAAGESQPRPLFRQSQTPPPRNPAFGSAPRRGSVVRPQQQEQRKPELVTEYTPESSMLRKVTVYRWQSQYNFYEAFCRDAERLYAVHGTECPRVEFFSYIPQYNQLSREQLAFYLYWRERVRRGEYPAADLSYILLYIYEIINLPDRIGPETGMSLLCDLWANYRARYPRIDKYLVEWVCDYGLINRLPPPIERIGGFFKAVVDYATVKEYYMTVGARGGSFSTEAAVVADYASGYRYRESKYAQGEAAPLFEEHITGAVARVLSETERMGKPLLDDGHLRPVKVSRDAFCGSLCAYNIKRRIDLEYLSFSRSHEFRDTVTDVVKYAENRIRAHLKIKSRLGNGSLPEHIKKILDAYFDENLPTERRRRKSDVPETPEYEKLYDTPASTLTPDRAAEIEAASWATTEKLVTTLNDEAEADIKSADSPIKSTETPEIPADSPVKSADTPEIPGKYARILPEIPAAPSVSPTGYNIYDSFIAALDADGEADLAALIAGRFTERCRRTGRFADAAAAALNDAAVAATGDIIAEPDSAGEWDIIADYREELTDAFDKQTR